MSWYKKLPTPRRASDRLRDSRKYIQRGDTRHRKPLAARNPNYVFFKTYCRKIAIQGYNVKVMSRGRIAKFFDVPISTVHYWDRAGVLPAPFYWSETRRKPYPYFLASQIRCLALVVNDLVATGYVSIPWYNLPDHIAMVHEGYKHAYGKFDKRFTKVEPTDVDKFGVAFFDD